MAVSSSSARMATFSMTWRFHDRVVESDDLGELAGSITGRHASHESEGFPTCIS
jgi:hypothetical protein